MEANQPLKHRSEEPDSLTVFFLRVSSFTVFGVEVHYREEGVAVKIFGLEKLTK